MVKNDNLGNITFIKKAASYTDLDMRREDKNAEFDFTANNYSEIKSLRNLFFGPNIKVKHEASRNYSIFSVQLNPCIFTSTSQQIADTLGKYLLVENLIIGINQQRRELQFYHTATSLSMTLSNTYAIDIIEELIDAKLHVKSTATITSANVIYNRAYVTLNIDGMYCVYRYDMQTGVSSMARFDGQMMPAIRYVRVVEIESRVIVAYVLKEKNVVESRVLEARGDCMSLLGQSQLSSIKLSASITLDTIKDPQMYMTSIQGETLAIFGSSNEGLSTSKTFNITLVYLLSSTNPNISRSIQFELPIDLQKSADTVNICHSTETVIFLLKIKSDSRYIIYQRRIASKAYYKFDLRDKLAINKASMTCDDNTYILVAESNVKLIVAGISQSFRVNVTERIQVMAEYSLNVYADLRIWTTKTDMYVALKPVDEKLREKVDCLSLIGLKRVYLMARNDENSMSDNEFDLRFLSNLNLNGPAADLHTKANYLSAQEISISGGKSLAIYIGR